MEKRNRARVYMTNQATNAGPKIPRPSHRLLLAIAFAIVALIAVAIVTRPPGLAQTSGNGWEYKIARQWDENEFTRLGSDGWELVAVDSTRGDGLRAFFKRPRR